MDYTKAYRSTDVFTVKKIMSMDVELVEVTNEYGMVSARLPENDFLQQFEQVPEPTQ